MIPLLLAAAFAAGPVDLNQSTVEELDGLPGLGSSKAEAIVQHREMHGPFQTLDDLLGVSGIGPGIVAILRGQVALGEVVTPDQRSSPPSTEARMPFVPSATEVNPNTATIVEFAALPGISGARAEAIVNDRETNGPFESCQDLTRVEGIGRATVAQLRGLCGVEL